METWSRQTIETLHAKPSEADVVKLVGDIALTVNNLCGEPPDEAVLYAIEIVIGVELLLDKLPARHLTRQVLNSIGNTVAELRSILVRPTRTPPDVLGKIVAMEKTIEPLLARPYQQDVLNAIKSIESSLNASEDERHKEPWSTVSNETDAFDTTMVEKWNKEMDTLLVYASLFSAIVATFAVEVLSGSADNGTTTENDGGTNTRAGEGTSSSNNISIKRYNSLVFVSLILALATASTGTLVKQWIQQYLEDDPNSTRYDHVCLRQYRYDGLNRWHVSLLVGLLPVILRLSFILFATGLAIRLYDFDHTAAILFAVFGGVWFLFYTFATLSPLFSDSCPYRSPESLLVLNVRLFFQRHFSHSPNSKPYLHYGLPGTIQRLLPSHLPFRSSFHHFLREGFRYLVRRLRVKVQWATWQKQDCFSVIPQSNSDHGTPKIDMEKSIRDAIERALAEVATTENAFHSLHLQMTADPFPDPEARQNPLQPVVSALAVLSKIRVVLKDLGDESDRNKLKVPIDSPLLARTLSDSQTRSYCLTKDTEDPIRRDQLKRYFGDQWYRVIEQTSKLADAIEQALSEVQRWNKKTELGRQALVTTFFEFAPSKPSLATAVGICAQSFHAMEALQIVHRVGLKYMRNDPGQANEYVGPQRWRNIWKHWDESDDMVEHVRGLTRRISKALLEIVSNAVSNAFIREEGDLARKDRRHACFIGDIAEPASSCLATLLMAGRLGVETDLRKSVAHAILKLLADYNDQAQVEEQEQAQEQEREQGQEQTDGWLGVPLVAFRAAIRLCQDGPSDATYFLEKPTDFTVSREKIEKLLRNASNKSGDSGEDPIWFSVFRTEPHLDPSITAYVLLRLATLSNVNKEVIDAFFDEWSDRYYGHTLEQQHGPWAHKVLDCIRGTPFDELHNAKFFKRMFGWNEQ